MKNRREFEGENKWKALKVLWLVGSVMNLKVKGEDYGHSGII
jgi:hypothetical protein